MRQLVRIFVALLLGCAIARADVDPADAKQHFRAGLSLFHRGAFEPALAEFETSYRLNPVPEVVFNIAMTQKSLHRWAEAARSFERYLDETHDRTTPVAHQRRAEAERALAEARMHVPAEPKPPEPVPVASPPVEPPVVIAPTVAPPSMPAAPALVAPPRRPVWKRPALWLGVGIPLVVGAVTLGVVLGVRGRSSDPPCDARCADFRQ